jgi:hypothetical protein
MRIVFSTSSMTSHSVQAAEEGRLSGLALSGNEGNRARMEEPGKDSFLVTWNGSDDPENPKNWTNQQKWEATFVRFPNSSSGASNIFGNTGCGILYFHLTRVLLYRRSCYPKDR